MGNVSDGGEASRPVLRAEGLACPLVPEAQFSLETKEPAVEKNMAGAHETLLLAAGTAPGTCQDRDGEAFLPRTAVGLWLRDSIGRLRVPNLKCWRRR